MKLRNRRLVLFTLLLSIVIPFFYLWIIYRRNLQNNNHSFENDLSLENNTSAKPQFRQQQQIQQQQQQQQPKIVQRQQTQLDDELRRKLNSPLLPKALTLTLPEDVTCVRDFLSQHERYCAQRLRPKPRNTKFPEKFLTKDGNVTNLCPCLPDNLLGLMTVDVNKTAPSIREIESEFRENENGGRWSPSFCAARHRIAIIVPYADRVESRRKFLLHMHRLLQRQLVDYNIFFVEQLEPKLFNRAMLMNVGFVETRSLADYDCFIFHDVDQLPIDDRNFYVCSDVPRHVVGYRKKFNYGIAYPTSFAGGNSFTRRQFELINGFGNTFYGWGGEDDDLYLRTQSKKFARTRYPRCIAKYDEIVHVRDKRNPMGVNQPLGWKFRPNVYETEGITSLNYTKLKTEKNKLYTMFSVTLPPVPPELQPKQVS